MIGPWLVYELFFLFIPPHLHQSSPHLLSTYCVRGTALSSIDTLSQLIPTTHLQVSVLLFQL